MAENKDSGHSGGEEPGIGERFHQQTKYAPDSLEGHALDWGKRPAPVKHVETALGRIPLPEPARGSEPSLWEVLARRRSRRVYAAEETLSLEHLSSLLWATQGLTAQKGSLGFRAAPSAGALYPIETYCLCRDVEGLEPGMYHFCPAEFDLELLRRGHFAQACALGALGQSMVADAQATFLWTAVIARSTWKYRQRAFRYIYMDAGHIGQNLYLAAEALGLGVCGVGAFFDDELNALLGVDGREETVVYLAPVGVLRGSRRS